MKYPSDMKTDFKSWDREVLETFAREAADELARVREENRILLDAWRKAVIEHQTEVSK